MVWFRSTQIQWHLHFLRRVRKLYSFLVIFIIYLSSSSDDGSRLYVNGQELVNAWNDQALTENSGTITLVQGRNYSIVYQVI
jgi:hypothetical protein